MAKGKKSGENVGKRYPSNQSQLNFIQNNFLEDKTGSRVPRASNLSILKRIVLSLGDKMPFMELLSLSEIEKRSHFIEYLNLLVKLGWACYKEDYVILTAEGKVIVSKLSKDKFLSENDCDIIKKDLFKLIFIKKFLLNIFHFDITSQRSFSGVCLTKEDITNRYLDYRKISPSVAERESRLIYNWLQDLKILETLPIMDKYVEDKVCYHLVGGDISFEKFANKIKPTVFRVMERERKTSAWVDIPKVRNIFCIENDISKSKFDELFLTYIKKYPKTFQITTATALRPEVEREGIKINAGKIYFYVKLSGDL